MAEPNRPEDAQGNVGSMPVFALCRSGKFEKFLDGEVEVTISGKPIHLKKGEMTIMPANHTHALTAKTKFKMLLTMIKS